MSHNPASRLDLKPTEQNHVRTALRFLRVRCGDWTTVAKVLGFNANVVCTVTAGKRMVSPLMAFRVARFVGVPLDAVLTGAWPSPLCCPLCGQMKPSEAPTEESEVKP